MYAKTDNPYRFKYLVTGITGPGIPCVYLPPEPPDEEVLFKKEQKFVRPVPPNYLKEWMDEFVYETENTRKQQEKNPEKIFLIIFILTRKNLINGKNKNSNDAPMEFGFGIKELRHT